VGKGEADGGSAYRFELIDSLAAQMNRNRTRYESTKPVEAKRYSWPEPEATDRIYREIMKRSGDMTVANYNNRLNRQYSGRDNLNALIRNHKLSAWTRGTQIGKLPDGTNLAGIDPHTGRVTGGNGVFFPAYNRIDGQDLIVGGQIWTLQDNGKKLIYWASSDKATGLGPQTPQTGELPLFQNLEWDNINYLHLCEGGEKALLLHEFLQWDDPRRDWDYGTSTVGAAGGQFGRKALCATLDLLNWDDRYVNPVKIFLWPDAGSCSNPDVIKSYARTIGIVEEYLRANCYEASVEIVWWDQYFKDHDPDPDELAKMNPTAIQFFPWRSSVFAKEFLEYLEENQPVPFVRTVEEIRAKKEEKLAKVERVVWEPGQDLEAIIAKSGRPYIIDLRRTGAGKTHSIEQIKGPFYYVTQNPYNPGTPFLATIQKLTARHDGRYLHPTLLNGAGLPKNEGKPNGGEEIASNCSRNEGYSLLIAHGVEESICNGCPNQMSCVAVPGNYLHDYGREISSPRLIMHPLSIPKKNLEDKVIIFDDVPTIEPEQKTFTRSSILYRASKVRENNLYPKVLKELFELLEKLSAEAMGQKYGLPEKAVTEVAKALARFTRTEVRDFLNFEAESSELDYEGQGVYLKKNVELKRDGHDSLYLRDHKIVQAAAEENRLEALNNSYVNGQIGQLVDVLFNYPDAIYKFDSEGRFIISYRKEVINRAIRSAKQVRIMDATINVDAFMSLYQIHPSELLIIESVPDAENKNLAIAMVRGIGGLTSLSTDRQNEIAARVAIARAKELGVGKVGFIGAEVILDAFRSELTEAGVIVGKPHSDSRGSNAFTECTEIYVGSSLRKNIGAMLTEFGICYRQLVIEADGNPYYTEFKQQQQASEVAQAIGRLRNGRRQGEFLKVFFLGDIDPSILKSAADQYDGSAHEVVDACDLDGYMPTIAERHREDIYHALAAWGDGKLTYRALGKIVGIDCSTVSRLLDGRSLVELAATVKSNFESGLDFLRSQRLALIDPTYYNREYGGEIGLPVPEPTDEELMAGELTAAAGRAVYRDNRATNKAVLNTLIDHGIEPPIGSPWNVPREWDTEMGKQDDLDEKLKHDYTDYRWETPEEEEDYRREGYLAMPTPDGFF
jgi:hypothetical protein